MSEPGPKTELVAEFIYQFTLIAPFLPTYLHLIISALFPIFAGAHASLSRPLSAAKPTKKRKRRRNGSLEETSTKMEGLSPSDALLYPLLTGCMLAGLYVLIKWLKDPEILNKILNGYLSVFGIFSISKLLTDSMSTLNSFAFPSKYVDQGLVWELNDRENSFEATPTGAITLAGAPESRKSPLPGLLSRVPLPPVVAGYLWGLRDFTTRPLFEVETNIKGIIEGSVAVSPQVLVGFVASVASVLYFNLVARPWWLTNLSGFSFSYSALQLMSPTTFWTGTLLLTALFFYDIYFVFFTPMMITVATKLDIPVKLLFPRPETESDKGRAALAMLGLGDIVLPGLMIGLALRFDLYAFYLKKQKRKQEPTPEANNPVVKNAVTAIQALEELPYAPLVYGKDGLGKAEYKQATGNWGERYWLGSTRHATEGSSFPKPYFHASILGYILGMISTVGVMHTFKHGQPALLYLVPGVLISLWATAFFRGEVKMMWDYTEVDEEEEEEEKEKEKEKEKTEHDGKNTSGEKDKVSETSKPLPSSDRSKPSSTGTEPSVVDDSNSKKDEKSTKPSKSWFSFSFKRPTKLNSSNRSKSLKIGDTLADELRKVSKGPVGAAGDELLDYESDEEAEVDSPSSGEFVISGKQEADGPGMKRRRIA